MQNEEDETTFKEWFNRAFESGKKNDFASELDTSISVTAQAKTFYSANIDQFIKAKEQISKALDNKDLFLASDTQVAAMLHKVCELIKTIQDLVLSFEKEFGFSSGLFELGLNDVIEKIQPIQTSLKEFRDVAAMNTIRKELESDGLGSVFSLLKKDGIDRNDLVRISEFGIYSDWLKYRLKDSKVLEQTSGLQLDNNNERYKASLNRYLDFSKQAMVAEATKNKPTMNANILPTSPVGKIIKESQKSRKIMPIRKFLDTVESVVPTLKPCFLMSPQSVSQYLPVAPCFDIVIFDEASQIPPWDAIGTMARGKQSIVVGDSKQLPPTSFFSTNGEDEEDEKIDCESVLEMFGTLFPELYLNWHYRSRSESLISFSNYHIYENRLHTFPSSHTNDQKVSLEVVTGDNAYYDRGKSKTNKAEAQAIVKEVLKRLKSKQFTKSIGIVTFSTPQSTLIEDLFEDALLKNSMLEPYFDSNNDEYVFVKNLESVQGDERDVILFSIGYGKDHNGIINRNFGPLNNSGGERRLNVAITRAREEIKIFSNFHAREFNVGTSKSEGLSLLKEYLAFAEDGHSALFRRQQFNDQDEFDSPFEEEVAVALREKGWDVKTQIGVGGYRIDLAVIDLDNKGHFLAGVECDGARYHSAKTARDRDILRQSVLEGLGWKILRIWSTDWWHNKSRCVKQIHEKLTKLQNQPESDKESELEADYRLEGESSEETIEQNIETTPVETEEEQKETFFFDPDCIKIDKWGDFYTAKTKVKKQLQEVVDTLGPISVTECYTIIRNGWGFKRIGNAIQEFLDECSFGLHKTKHSYDTFFWKTKEHPNHELDLRIPVNGNQRHPKTISPHELGAGILEVLVHNKEADKKELYRSLSKKLGFASLSKDAESVFEEATQYLSKKKIVEIAGESLKIIEGS